MSKEGRLELDVDGHVYWLQQSYLQLEGWDGRMPDGLVAVLDDQGQHSEVGYQAIIRTGVDMGVLWASLELLDHDPGAPTAEDLDVWDEISEFSLDLGPDGAGLMSPGEDTPWRFPLLPAGPVRIRVHAQGRDASAALDNGGVIEEAVEEHWILAWPAPPSARVQHQTRDQFGALTRSLPGLPAR